jgi:ribosomal protein S27AE
MEEDGVIDNDEQAARLVLTCDRCGAQAAIDTAGLQIHPLEEATHRGWGVRTEEGDLCPRCARDWVLAAISRALGGGDPE